MKCRLRHRVLLMVAFLLTVVGVGKTEDSPRKRRAAAQKISLDISRLDLHKVYVPDLVDNSGQRTVAGCYFGAAFSKLLAEKPKNFAIVARSDVHRYLDNNGWTDADISRADVISRLVAEFSLDAVLSGVISKDRDSYTMEFTIRDLSGQELSRTQYQEKTGPTFSANLPAEGEVSGHNFYFAGLDGVTIPKCMRCPSPDYPGGKRSTRVQGSIVLSVLITADGKADHLHLIKGLDPDLDQMALDTVESWRFEPSRDPTGLAVAVRVPIEVTYKLF
jgi:TonB family protein